MGFFDRFKRVVKANLNSAISKAENPEKMLNQLITDMNQQLIEVKKSVAGAIADEKRIERQMNEQLKQSADWENRAILALKAGKEDLAREALGRKRESDEYAGQYREQWESQHQAVEKLKTHLRGLQQKIEEAQRKKNLLIARSKRVEAQKRIHETMGGLSDTSAFEVFDRMNRRIEDMEAETEALGELVNSGSTEDDIEKQFQALEGSSGGTPDTMLEDLKQKIALEGPQGDTAQNTGDVEDDDLAELKKKLQDDESSGS
ncbi:PspA/IM30 family protein [Spirochaeta africana]|uniref:PspA/IM30 family protein n=1 Tax=Spirochaeta africana TaxID=46355 RepID=UPI00031E6927|nr:PspA/IM30 family protein [Spirochaeta africana]